MTLSDLAELLKSADCPKFNFKLQESWLPILFLYFVFLKAVQFPLWDEVYIDSQYFGTFLKSRSFRCQMNTQSERKLYACGYNGFAQLPLKDDKFEKSRAILSPEQCIYCPPESGLAHCLAVGWSRCFFKKGTEIFQYGRSFDQTNRKSVIQNIGSVESIHCFDGTLFTTESTSRNILVAASATERETIKLDYQDESDAKVVYLDSDVNNLFALTGKGAGKLEQAGKSLIYKKVFTEGQVDALSCGKEHVLLLTKKRSGVYSWSCRGQLGHGIIQDKLETPTQVDAIAAIPIKVIAAGGWHSVAVSEYGDLYIWGWNVNGQLGFPKQPVREQSEVSSPPVAKRRRCTATKDEAHKDQRTANNPEDHEEVPSTGANELAQGGVGLAISFLTSPQILDMSPPEEILVKSASCGSRHTAAVTRDGRLYTWGFGRWGQLGHGDEWTRDCPTRVDSLGENGKVLEVYCREWNTFIVVEDTTL